jgi:tetratricopeptide (TPR) repeat protein
MKSRVLVVFLLLPWIAIAQRDPTVDMQTIVHSIDMTSSARTDLELKRRHPDEFARNGAAPMAPFVSANELGVPAQARREVEKANEFLVKRDYTHALQRLKKAVAVYPAYAGAYNDLGVIYGRTGDVAHEREALERAISLNDHFALAYLNLARMNIVGSDFRAAKTALEKASAFDPGDPVSLTLLAYVELSEGDLDSAIATSQKAHGLSKPHAFAHHLAARAFESEKQFDRAIAELETSLLEEPVGPRADGARQELEILRSARIEAEGTGPR